MLILGAVICELLGDPKWTKRLRDRAGDYRQASKTPGLDRETKYKLSKMVDRANSLEYRNKLFINKKDIPNYADNLNRAKESYKQDTRILYPKRALHRAEINKAKSMLPKSLQK